MEKKSFKTLAVGRTDIFMLNPEDIHVDESENLRIDYGDIEGFADFISENGIPSVLTVRMDKNGVVKLTDGFRRMRACKVLKERGNPVVAVPCIREERNTSEEQRIVNILAFAEGKNLSILEQGLGYKKLKNLGWTPQMIAKKVAKSLPHVYQALELAGAPVAIQQAIKAGEISSSTALQTLKASESDTEAVKVVEKAIKTAKENGAKKATSSDVQAVASNNAPVSRKVNIAGAFKSYKEFIEENEIVMKEYPKYKVAAAVVQFLNGEMTEGEFVELIKA